MKRQPRVDAVELEVFKNIFHSIAEEMGAALRRTAFSPNIKERRDYSCAVFNAAGEVIEDDPSLTPVGDPSEIGKIASGSSDRTITVTLQPGHYVIFCNLHVGDLLHYQKGMHVDFTVT